MTRIKSRVELFLEKYMKNFKEIKGVHLDTGLAPNLYGALYLFIGSHQNCDSIEINNKQEYRDAMAFQTYFIKQHIGDK